MTTHHSAFPFVLIRDGRLCRIYEEYPDKRIIRIQFTDGHTAFCWPKEIEKSLDTKIEQAIGLKGNKITAYTVEDYERLCTDARSLRGEWDPKAGSGWISFANNDVARRVAVEVLLS